MYTDAKALICTKFRVSANVAQFRQTLSSPVLGGLEAVVQLEDILKSPPYKICLISGPRAEVMTGLGKDRNKHLEPFSSIRGGRIEEKASHQTMKSLHHAFFLLF